MIRLEAVSKGYLFLLFMKTYAREREGRKNVIKPSLVLSSWKNMLISQNGFE